MGILEGGLQGAAAGTAVAPGIGTAIGAGVGAIGGLADTLIQNRMNRRNQDRQNAYNSPAAQMQRYREAGLNPNLIYSQGSPGNQPGVVSTESPVGKINALDTLARMYAIEDLKQGIELKKDQGAAIRQGTYNATLDAVVKRAAGTQAQALAEYAPELSKYQVEGKRAAVRKLIVDADVNQLRGLNFQLDRELKSEVLHEKKYYNRLLDATGIGRGDSILFRGAATWGPTSVEWLRSLFEKGK